MNGVVTSIATFVEEFRKQGHRVVIFAPSSSGDQKLESDVIRFPAVVYPFQKEYVFALPFLKPIQNFESFKFDIVHIQTPFSMGLYGLKLAKKYNIPTVHTYHTFFERYVHYIPILPLPFLTKAARKISEKFCNQFNLVLAPSPQMASHLKNYNVTTPIEVIPTGIEPPNVTEIDQFEMAKRFNIKKTENWVIFGGRLGKEKNVYFMIDAFIKMANVMPDLKLLVVGDGPERDGLTQKIKAANLTDRVVFTGYLTRKQMICAFSLAKLYLFPSVTETQGLTLLESFSVGTPAACIRSMGSEYLMKNGVGGVLVDENLETYVSEALKLLTDSALRRQKSDEARQRANEFSATALSSQVLNLYERLI